MIAVTEKARHLCVCASERVKLFSATDGLFPDIGHHLEKEMGGLWLHPIKLLDGFWLRFHDCTADNVDTWILADGFENRPYGNAFTYRGGLGHTQISIIREQLAPEAYQGVLVKYTFHNYGDKKREVGLQFVARTDLRPVWFSENAGIMDGQQDVGAWDEGKGLFCAKDSDHEWHTAIGASWRPESVQVGEYYGPEITSNNGVACQMDFSMSMGPYERKELIFAIAGSYTSQEECLAQAEGLQALQWEAALQEKQARVKKLLSRAKLHISDEGFENVYNWIKVHTDWLILNAGPYGRGLTAGFPEYPWWFGCDNCYALQGVLAMGDFELARDTLELLLSYAETCNGNGRIPHEITPYGVCVNPGNTQETAHFITAVWHYYAWTGDEAFIKRAFPYLTKSIDWLSQMDGDGDLFPSGYGIMEIEGLNSELIDSAVYTAQAYGCYANMCRMMGDETEGARCDEMARRTLEAINASFWDEEEGLYCDTVTDIQTVESTLHTLLEKSKTALRAKPIDTIEALLEKKRCLGDTESGWLINRNWVILTPMETGLAPRERAERALETMYTDAFVGKYGMFLSGLDKGSIMTISTGVQAVAQARYGYVDRALGLLEKMFSTFGMATPGCLSEMSPDYGCFVQAWTAYAAFVPVVQGFFGIRPDAYSKTITVAPCIPKAWENGGIENVRVLDGAVTVQSEMQDGHRHYRIKSSATAALSVQVPPGDTYECI